MLEFIIRLDDATPKMNKAGWQKIESLLDKYHVKPIVGIIPESKDTLFYWEEDPDFWTDTVKRWQEKGWVIAQHGCHHVYHNCANGVRSEFVGLTYDEQMHLIKKGHNALICHGVEPTCFFAPAHTFDDTTVDVCRDSGYFKFISDGYALFPYIERNMLFLPSIFDTAHKLLPVGVYTFVLHPSFTTEKELEHLEAFIRNNQKHFHPIPKILERVNQNRQKNFVEKCIHPAMKLARGLRKRIRGVLHG